MNLKKVNQTPQFDMKGDSIEDLNGKQLIEKLAISLRLIHKNLFVKEGYSVKELIKDIKENVSNLQKGEENLHFLVEKLGNIIKNNIKKKKNLKSKSVDFSKQNIMLKDYREPVILIQPQRPIENRQANFNWSSVDVFKDLKSKDEDYLKDLKEKETKKNYSDFLAKQLQQKAEQLKKEKELQSSFIKKHMENALEQDQREKFKQAERLVKLKRERELMISIDLERKRTVEKQLNQHRIQTLIEVQEHKNQLQSENELCDRKKRDLKKKLYSIMTDQLNEKEKERELTKIFKKEEDQKERSRLEKELNSFIEEKIRKENKRKKDTKDGLILTERIKSIANLSQINEETKERDKLNNEKSNIEKSFNQKELEKKNKQRRMISEMTAELHNQMAVKKLNELIAKEEDIMTGKRIAESVSVEKNKELDKLLQKKIIMKKLKVDWDNQGKLSDKNARPIEMSENEKRINKALIDEMSNYRSPRGNNRTFAI